MLDARIKPQRKTLMALADAFSGKNDVAGVRDVHSLAMQGAQDLRMRDIDRLTLSYMRCGDTASIEKLLDLTRNRQMEPPGSYFARLIINYARDGRIGDAYDLYEEAKRRRDTGLDCVYNAMIDAFGMNGQLGQALKTFHMVQNKTPATYEKLAKAYSLKKEVEGVVFCAKNIALLQPRRKYNVQVHLIRAFGLQRNLVSAKGAFDAVKDEVKGPTLAIYESMMHAYGHCGNPDGSILVLRELEERMGFTPNCFTMTHIVDAYGINGQYEKAYAVFENIMERGMLPDVHAYNSMIRAFCMSFKFGEAMGVLGNMLERNLLPNGHTCRAFLSAYLTLGDLTSACRIFELLLKVQPKPGYRAYEMLIEGFQSQANLQEAVNAFKDMRRVGIPTDDELIDRIVAFKHETALEGAREGFHKHLKRGMPTSVDQPVADGTLLTEGRNHGFSTP
uniref:Pentacotripeptide-repeat region of PRORP domain-containing protein n=1 Tax=Rhodosorus marinus TaxID=101924 RepID=A0A7S3ENH7_9RHOD|mmetsp:Transcript_5752/g.24240  ORF Transcript_5752/g.24240 Transcript_5752/m.24240 type:complete len:448 (+) Transcript_5752:1332-2675(+)